MDTNNSSSSLLVGLAVFGLALVVAGMGLYRRRARSTAGGLQSDLQAETGSGDEEQSTEAEPPDDREPPIHADPDVPQDKVPLDYFALVFALTTPLWIYGGSRLPIPVKLPVSALSLVIPLIAALILTYRRAGLAGVKDLFRKVVDYRKIRNKTWYLPTLFLYPLISVASHAVMRLAGLPLPDPQIPWIMAPVYLLLFFIAGIGEELGWMGYAFDPMQNRWGALKASILLGLVWAIYHLIPDMQNQQAGDWILWHRLGTIAFRVLIAWVYNNTGKSVFTAILFHATNNLSWALFPNNGSHYNPFINLMLTLPVVAFIITAWDSKTLARFRFARSGGTRSRDGQETLTTR